MMMQQAAPTGCCPCWGCRNEPLALDKGATELLPGLRGPARAEHCASRSDKSLQQRGPTGRGDERRGGRSSSVAVFAFDEHGCGGTICLCFELPQELPVC